MFSKIIYTMRKYTGTEKTEVLSPEDHQTISATLRRVGKTSMQQLSDAEKLSLEDSLESDKEV